MARKKKQSRKYIPKNEFRVNNSPSAEGHPHYVFGETKTKYKSMGLTHNPDGEHKYILLSKNPNPSDNGKSYLRFEVQSANKKYYKEPLVDWSFSKEDMAFVRHRVKNYKKSTNRRPKNWYVKKRQWNKKNKK